MQISKYTKVVLGVAALIISTSGAIAGNTTMQVAGRTTPPVGHVEFCRKHPSDCGAYSRPDQVVHLTPVAWTRLQQLNTAVNTAVLPATDMEIFGTLEHWDYPALTGDCEDYVLEKRRELTDAGWPASALLITVVRDEIGEGHAVLTVRTDRGDLVLDNKTDEIVVWEKTPYQYVKRQSARNAAAWDSIEDERTTAVGSLR